MSFPAGAQSGAGSRCVAINLRGSRCTMAGAGAGVLWSLCRAIFPAGCSFSQIELSRAGHLCCPSSRAGLWLHRHGQGTSQTSSCHQTTDPRGSGEGARLGQRAQERSSTLGRRKFLVSMGTGGGKFLGLRLGFCQPGEAAGPRGSHLPSLLSGEGWCPAASPTACAPTGAPRDEGCAGTPRPPLRSCVRCGLTFSSQLSEEMQR